MERLGDFCWKYYVQKAKQVGWKNCQLCNFDKTDVLFNIAVHLDTRIKNDRFMTLRKMISSIWNAYLRVLSKYPMGTQIVQTGKAFFPNNNYFIF